MRVLLSCSLGGTGHLLPVAAAAESLDRLGHETLVLVPPSLAARAGEANLSVTVGEQPPADVIEAVWERVRRGPAGAVTGLIDREVFADHGAEAMMSAAEEAVRRFRPDLVLREPTEYAAAVAAHRAGIPQALVAISQSRIEHRVLGLVSDLLERRSPGLTDVIAAGPFLTRFPAQLDPSPWADTRRFREPMLPSQPLPDWWPGDERPLVYLTFGTVFGRRPEETAVYGTAVTALAELPARVLLTLGPDTPGPARAPHNVHIERWVDQAAVLPHASLVICHGGSGTVFGALAHGIPLVICPFFADQSANGRLVESAGAGRVLRSANLTGLGELAQTVLMSEPSRHAARGIAATVKATPSLDVVLTDLISSIR